eukprot:scaffold146_cov265-Pinguiococcus_pyrenoidosus.AAC.26
MEEVQCDVLIMHAHRRCVAITQPRRIAAVTCAQRVAQEMACELGQEVGFHVRFERKATDATRVLFCTDGSLVRETLRDPLLTKYSVVILDEAHERSLHTDVLIGILKKIMRVRQQLRLIISSATLDAELFRDFFNTNMGPQPEIRMPGARGRPDRLWRLENATIVSVPGRTFPVDILHREEPVGEYIRAAVETVHHIHNTENPGDILVFLPGAAEVDTAVEMCRDSDASDGNTIVFLPLYAALPRHMQINAFRPAPRGKRKVVFSTNVAETSVTIVGIKFVVDCGFSRMPYYDAERDYQVGFCTWSAWPWMPCRQSLPPPRVLAGALYDGRVEGECHPAQRARGKNVPGEMLQALLRRGVPEIARIVAAGDPTARY